jgi:hypothetical protein
MAKKSQAQAISTRYIQIRKTGPGLLLMAMGLSAMSMAFSEDSLKKTALKARSSIPSLRTGRVPYGSAPSRMAFIASMVQAFAS